MLNFCVLLSKINDASRTLCGEKMSKISFFAGVNSKFEMQLLPIDSKFSMLFCSNFFPLSILFVFHGFACGRCYGACKPALPNVLHCQLKATSSCNNLE